MRRDGEPGHAVCVPAPVSLGMTRVCLAKTLNFACLSRHATSDSLLSLFAADLWPRFGPDAKAWITVPITDAQAARDEASVDRKRTAFADQHDRYGRPDEEGSKGSRSNVFLSRSAKWRDCS